VLSWLETVRKLTEMRFIGKPNAGKLKILTVENI